MRTSVLGIVNVTPDSFSDGGQHFSAAKAISHGINLVEHGADLLDIGGESTRPGADRIEIAEELRRVIPVIRGLADVGVPLSVDTMHAQVAYEAVLAGAVIVNDVSGGLADERMDEVVAELGVDYVLGHWPKDATGRLSHSVPDYVDVLDEVTGFFRHATKRAVRAGVDPARIIWDPGLGFAKNASHNWALLANIERLTVSGHRVLVGASRKRFLGELLDSPAPRSRDDATAAITAWCAERNVWAVRTHEVASNRAAATVIAALTEAIR